MSIRVPPLRERREDIPLLLGHFIDLGRAEGLPEFCAGDDVMRALMSYEWPGNVRELKHCVDRMAALRSEGALQMGDMPSALHYQANSNSPPDLGDVLEQHPFGELPDSEQQAIRNALAETRGERARAAALLKIGRTTLYRKMKQYGIA
jgi:DNA-binding NtrC family response regulator